MPDLSRNVHEVLVEALDAASYSASKLAADANLDWSTLAKWKAGTRTPKLRNLREVALALTKKGQELVAIAEELSRVSGLVDSSIDHQDA